MANYKHADRRSISGGHIKFQGAVSQKIIPQESFSALSASLISAHSIKIT